MMEQIIKLPVEPPINAALRDLQGQHLTKISIFKEEGIMEKVSYDHSVYESVDDKSLS